MAKQEEGATSEEYSQMQDGKNRRKLTTDILTHQMWGKSSTLRQNNEVYIGELITLISVFNK
jgi:hypothetical protein